MILDVLPRLNALRIVLASGSPRRREMLQGIGLRFDVVPSKFAEDLPKGRFTPEEYVVETARRKAFDVFTRLSSDGAAPPDLIISSDTVVVLDGRIMEKPASEADAKGMLADLSGRSNTVLSAVALVLRDGGGEAPPESGSGATHELSAAPPEGSRCVSFVEAVAVHFDDLTPGLIDAYVASGEPMDKAGGFGIQGSAASFIRGVEGDVNAVIGFPLNAACRVIRGEVEAGRLGAEAAPGGSAGAGAAGADES